MRKNKLTDETEKPKRTSLILCTILQTIGWLLVIEMVITFIMTITGIKPGPVEEKEPFELFIVLSAYWFAFDFLFMGVAAVILGQLARFIFQKTYRPGLMLRHGSKILIVFACLIAFWVAFQYSSLKPLLHNTGSIFPAYIFPSVVKASLLILLAQILKRIIPIIKESKTLV